MLPIHCLIVIPLPSDLAKLLIQTFPENFEGVVKGEWGRRMKKRDSPLGENTKLWRTIPSFKDTDSCHPHLCIGGYFSGDAFYEAGTSTTTVPAASISAGGKIGNYFHSQGALVLDFGSLFVDDDGINTIFFAKVGAAHDWTTNPTVSVATFKADAGTRSITVQLVSATPNINLVVSYISAVNETTTFTTTYALSTDTVFHENWNNIVVVRASSPLVPVEGVSIFINGKPTTDGLLIVDGDALQRTFAIDATGHLFGSTFADIDEVSVWSNSVVEIDVPTIAGFYANGYCPGWDSKYGGSDPIFAASYANDVLTIDVTVPKNSYQTVLDRIDNAPNLRDVCLTNADSFTTSAGYSWKQFGWNTYLANKLRFHLC